MRLSVVHKASIAGVVWGMMNVLFSLSTLLEGSNQHSCIYRMLCPIPEPTLDYASGIPWFLIAISIPMLLLTGDIRQDIRFHAPYRFTRQGGRSNWYIRRSICAMASGISFVLAYTLVVVLCAIVFPAEGGNLMRREHLQMCGLYIVCMAPCIAMVVLSAWIVSMRLGARISMVVSMAVVLLLLFAGIAMAKTSSALAMWSFRLNPVCSAIPSWRDVSGYGFTPAKAAKGYGLLVGAWIQCTEIALVEVAGLRIVNKMDIASEP